MNTLFAAVTCHNSNGEAKIFFLITSAATSLVLDKIIVQVDSLMSSMQNLDLASLIQLANCN